MNLEAFPSSYLATCISQPKHNDQLFDEFGAPTCCSVLEEPDVRRKVQNVEAFPFERHEIAPGVIAIPTPGHRPGAVSYLVEVSHSNVLFAGDSIWHDREKWMALSNKKNRPVDEGYFRIIKGREFLHAIRKFFRSKSDLQY